MLYSWMRWLAVVVEADGVMVRRGCYTHFASCQSETPTAFPRRLCLQMPFPLALFLALHIQPSPRSVLPQFPNLPAAPRATRYQNYTHPPPLPSSSNGPLFLACTQPSSSTAPQPDQTSRLQTPHSSSGQTTRTGWSSRIAPLPPPLVSSLRLDSSAAARLAILPAAPRGGGQRIHTMPRES